MRSPLFRARVPPDVGDALRRIFAEKGWDEPRGVREALTWFAGSQGHPAQPRALPRSFPARIHGRLRQLAHPREGRPIAGPYDYARVLAIVNAGYKDNRDARRRDRVRYCLERGLVRRDAGGAYYFRLTEIHATLCPGDCGWDTPAPAEAPDLEAAK